LQKMLLPPEFDSRTVQPVASRYTNYDIRSTYRAMRRRIPGAWLPGHLKLISVAPNVFSIINVVLILPYKKRVSSQAPSTTREITVTFTGHSRTEGHYEICFVSPFGCLEYGSGSETFHESCGAQYCLVSCLSVRLYATLYQRTKRSLSLIRYGALSLKQARQSRPQRRLK